MGVLFFGCRPAETITHGHGPIANRSSAPEICHAGARLERPSTRSAAERSSVPLGIRAMLSAALVARRMERLK